MNLISVLQNDWSMYARNGTTSWRLVWFIYVTRTEVKDAKSGSGTENKWEKTNIEVKMEGSSEDTDDGWKK